MYSTIIKEWKTSQLKCLVWPATAIFVVFVVNGELYVLGRVRIDLHRNKILIGPKLLFLCLKSNFLISEVVSFRPMLFSNGPVRVRVRRCYSTRIGGLARDWKLDERGFPSQKLLKHDSKKGWMILADSYYNTYCLLNNFCFIFVRPFHVSSDN